MLKYFFNTIFIQKKGGAEAPPFRVIPTSSGRLFDQLIFIYCRPSSRSESFCPVIARNNYVPNIPIVIIKRPCCIAVKQLALWSFIDRCVGVLSHYLSVKLSLLDFSFNVGSDGFFDAGHHVVQCVIHSNASLSNHLQRASFFL